MAHPKQLVLASVLYAELKQMTDPDTRNVADHYRGISVEDIKTDMQSRAFAFHVAIENFQHDFNIGSIVRSANAFNASAVHIIGKKHWNKRGAMVTDKYLDVFQYTSVEEFVGQARELGLVVIGIDNTPGSVWLHDTELPKNCVLVFGQEGPGLSEEMKKHCQKIAAIQQFGSTRSINVGAAAAIVMYAWVSQHKEQNRTTKCAVL